MDCDNKNIPEPSEKETADTESNDLNLVLGILGDAQDEQIENLRKKLHDLNELK